MKPKDLANLCRSIVHSFDLEYNEDLSHLMPSEYHDIILPGYMYNGGILKIFDYADFDNDKNIMIIYDNKKVFDWRKFYSPPIYDLDDCDDDEDNLFEIYDGIEKVRLYLPGEWENELINIYNRLLKSELSKLSSQLEFRFDYFF